MIFMLLQCKLYASRPRVFPVTLIDYKALYIYFNIYSDAETSDSFMYIAL